jgi:hypothetical protein
MGYIDERNSGFTQFGQGTPKKVAVSDTSSPLLMANPLRLYFKIVNNTASPIWIQWGIEAVVGSGDLLRGQHTWEPTSGGVYPGQINAITNSGTPIQIDVIEGE